MLYVILSLEPPTCPTPGLIGGTPDLAPKCLPPSAEKQQTFWHGHMETLRFGPRGDIPIPIYTHAYT